jgi:glycogen debranching enzyme
MIAGPGDDLTARDTYYIRAAGPAAGEPRLVLKHDEAFLVSDRHGDFPDLPGSDFGFYTGGTRYLRTLELVVHGQRPLLLNAAVSDDGRQVAVDLTNPDLCHGDIVVLAGRTFRIARTVLLQADTLTHRLAIENFGREAHELVLGWRFANDFADVFEVRGLIRERRGEFLPPVLHKSSLRLSYRGLDDVVRATAMRFDPPPERLTAESARFRLALPAHGRAEVGLIAQALERGDDAVSPRPRLRARRSRTEPEPVVHTAHEQMNTWVARACHDLRMLSTETPDGQIAYAGIPWFVAPFGRDSLITALQVLPFEPALARGTLRFLAHHQGTRDDPFTDQEPGKILHEYRRGEMAARREIAFVPYYGSVDATPLFVMLVAQYLRWTDDRQFALEIWPAVERALRWLGGPDGATDRYLTYACRSALGLVNQGWKDSQDAIMHASGEPAQGPIALVEAQGYKYAALRGGAEIAAAVERDDVARPLGAAADQLYERFQRDYWMEEEGFYALALDGGGAPCRVISSNPAHCLWTGMIAPGHARAVADRLLSRPMSSGWGIRTLATGEVRYNPMSYHNGSVWPHDTAIAAMGLRAYGFEEAFLTLTTGLFEAALHCEGLRLPELFCGFPRVPGYGPTPYPVACSPQAWAAGVVLQLLQGMLGLVPDARQNRLSLVHPVLPPWLSWVEVRGLGVRSSRVDLRVTRGRRGAAVEVLNREGDAEITVTG